MPRQYSREPAAVRVRRKLKVDPVTGCWIFTGCISRDGYGRIFGDVRNRPVRAHRVMWEDMYGPIKTGMNVLHKCDNPPCCNPKHLFLGTHKDNSDDKIRKNRGNNLGERHANSKLTETDVREIRASKLHYKELARIYGISPANAHMIKAGKAWAWLK